MGGAQVHVVIFWMFFSGVDRSRVMLAFAIELYFVKVQASCVFEPCLGNQSIGIVFVSAQEIAAAG